MEKIILNAKKREITGRKVKELRKKGILPVVLYGKKNESTSLELDAKKFQSVLKKAGTSSLIDLKLDEKPEIKVLVQDVQLDPISNLPIHADLYAIQMDEEITTEIPIKFIGVSPAVKDQEGNFIANYDEIEVECLPADLIPEIVVDISNLKTFEDQIKVSDLDIPKNIKVKVDLNEVVALVNAPRSEEELEALEQEAAADTEKEVVEKMEEEAKAEQDAKDAEKEAKDGNKKEADTKKEDSDKKETK